MTNIREVGNALRFLNTVGVLRREVDSISFSCDSFKDVGSGRFNCRKWNYDFTIEEVPDETLGTFFGVRRARVVDFKRSMPEPGVPRAEQDKVDAFAKVVAGSRCLFDLKVERVEGKPIRLVIPLHFNAVQGSFLI